MCALVAIHIDQRYKCHVGFTDEVDVRSSLNFEYGDTQVPASACRDNKSTAIIQTFAWQRERREAPPERDQGGAKVYAGCCVAAGVNRPGETGLCLWVRLRGGWVKKLRIAMDVVSQPQAMKMMPCCSTASASRGAAWCLYSNAWNTPWCENLPFHSASEAEVCVEGIHPKCKHVYLYSGRIRRLTMQHQELDILWLLC
jgi:hypothetical protein